MKKIKSFFDKHKNFFLVKYLDDYLFLLPFALIFIVFTVLPVIISIVLSFTSFDVVQVPKFIGVQNYLRLFMNDALFPIALRNTLVIAMITGPIGYMLSLIVAWILNEFSDRVRTFLTLLFYAPVISGGAYMIWQIIFSGDANGYLNSLLIDWGITFSPIKWLTDSDYMMPSAIIIMIWMSFGTGFLSQIAGFKNIDKTLYEAGAIDGVKNRFQELWYITLPSMKPQLMFSAVMSITNSFGVGAVITAIYGFPSKNYAVYTLVHMLQDYGNIRFDMGYASAIATVLFVIMLVCNKLIQKLISKIGGK